MKCKIFYQAAVTKKKKKFHILTYNILYYCLLNRKIFSLELKFSTDNVNSEKIDIAPEKITSLD